jgi:hypothetical protein
VTITKEQILACKPELKEMEVPEWGGSVWIRPVTLGEQGRLADAGHKFEKADPSARLKGTTVKLITWVVSDETGNPMFADTDIPALMNQPATIFLKLQDAILELSGLTESSRAELEKNSATGQTDKPDS